MQSERNFLRALPRKFCSSALIEHAFAFSLFGAKGFVRFTVFFSALAVAAGSVGAAVCAKVVLLAPKAIASAVAAIKLNIFMI